MGWDREPARQPDEVPRHAVQITRDYWMGTTEVTQGQWRKLMGNNPSKHTSCGADCPVERVSWWDAIAYLNARSRSENLPICYSVRGCRGAPGDRKYKCKDVDFVGLDCGGYRLPTEAEWEYAARAGRASSRSMPALNAVAWHKGNSGKKSHPVGTRKPNAWGLHDTLGSVWEWCWDWAGPYGSVQVTNPTGPKQGKQRAGRGGSHLNDGSIVRLTNREPDKPRKRDPNLGFRSARTVLQAERSSRERPPEDDDMAKRAEDEKGQFGDPGDDLPPPGAGTEFVMGHGAGSLGFKGTGTGGGGDGGYGRIHGMGKIDTGGGTGVREGLGRKRTKRVGKLNLGSGTTTGFCKRSNVKSVVRRRAGAIRACYEARLQSQPTLAGKLTAKWTIAQNGSVRAATVSGSLRDTKVRSCLIRVLRRMRFAKPEGDVCKVQWPFTFSGGNQPEEEKKDEG
jgi:hypothetical protein